MHGDAGQGRSIGDGIRNLEGQKGGATRQNAPWAERFLDHRWQHTRYDQARRGGQTRPAIRGTWRFGLIQVGPRVCRNLDRNFTDISRREGNTGKIERRISGRISILKGPAATAGEIGWRGHTHSCGQIVDHPHAGQGDGVAGRICKRQL